MFRFKKSLLRRQPSQRRPKVLNLHVFIRSDFDQKKINISLVLKALAKKCCCGYRTVVRPTSALTPQQLCFRNTHRTATTAKQNANVHHANHTPNALIKPIPQTLINTIPKTLTKLNPKILVDHYVIWVFKPELKSPSTG